MRLTLTLAGNDGRTTVTWADRIAAFRPWYSKRNTWGDVEKDSPKHCKVYWTSGGYGHYRNDYDSVVATAIKAGLTLVPVKCYAEGEGTADVLVNVAFLSSISTSGWARSKSYLNLGDCTLEAMEDPEPLFARLAAAIAPQIGDDECTI